MPLLPQPNCQRPTATRFPGRNRGSVLPDGQGTDSGRPSPTTKPNPSPGYLPRHQPLAPEKTLTIRLPPRVVKRHLVAKKRFLSKIGRPLDGAGLSRDTMALYRSAVGVQVRPTRKTSGDRHLPHTGGHTSHAPTTSAPEPPIAVPTRASHPLEQPLWLARCPAIRGGTSCRTPGANRKPVRSSGRGGSSGTRLPHRRFGSLSFNRKPQACAGSPTQPPRMCTPAACGKFWENSPRGACQAGENR